MKRVFQSCMAALMLALVCAGCARHFTILTNSGQMISAHGKPRYDEERSVFVFKDPNGRKCTIPAGSVKEVAPSSEISGPTIFMPETR